MAEKRIRDFIEEYRAYAKDRGVLNQTTTGSKAVVLNQWLFENIDDIIECGMYPELRKLIDYYGIKRDQMIGLFDYATADRSIDWKTQEINELAEFIMSTYMDSDLVTVGGRSELTFTSFTIDPIVATHMSKFVDVFPWGNQPNPTPTQLKLIVDMYRRIDHATWDGNPSGGLWEWILQYGERAPVPFDIINRAIVDAVESGNSSLVAFYINPEFLRMQPLVTIDGDDTKLCKLWDQLTAICESCNGYPDELINGYKAVDFTDLYKVIYQDLLSIQKATVAEINDMITNGKSGKWVIQDYTHLSMYQTIVVNDDAEKNRLPIVPGLVL